MTIINNHCVYNFPGAVVKHCYNWAKQFFNIFTLHIMELRYRKTKYLLVRIKLNFETTDILYLKLFFITNL